MIKEELNHDLLYASDDGDLACVVNAIEKGADIDYIGNDFTTALQYAAMNGHLDIVQYLVEKVSISSTLNARIFCMNVVSAAFSSYMYVDKAAETTFVRKMRAYNIGEIDGRVQT